MSKVQVNFPVQKNERMTEKKTLAFVKYLPVVGLALLAACTSPPDYPIEPRIEFLSLSKDTLKRGNFFQDTAFITISFTDGDGDIGDKDSLNLFLKDLRDGFVSKNRIPFVPELGASNGLKGEITVRIFSTCCVFDPGLGLDPCMDAHPSLPVDELVYEIYIVDRAGHESNTVQTAPIFIPCN
jgi:hypothetical protein